MLRELGRAARAVREDAGVHQAAIAGELGVHQATLARFENGLTWPKNPDATVEAYARCCAVSEKELWQRALEQLP